MSGFLLLAKGQALLTSSKGRNASRDGLVKIGLVVYSLLFPCIFDLGKLLMPCCARMLLICTRMLPIRCKVFQNTKFIHITQNG